jgi:hypothetical protein
MGRSNTILKFLGLLVPVVAIFLGLTQFRVWPSSVWLSKESVSVLNASSSDAPISKASSSKASSSSASRSSTSNTNAAISKPKTYPLSDDPKVVYIKDFLTAEEAEHLVGLT